MSVRRAGVLLIAWLSLTGAGCSYDFAFGEDAPGDSGVMVNGDLGKVGAICQAYDECESGDCASGSCVDRSAWLCKSYGTCVWDGGPCRADLATCRTHRDCCSGECGAGQCLPADPGRVLPLDAGRIGLCNAGGTCSAYSDCCSEACYSGVCAQLPPNGLCVVGTPCVAFYDCCSFECRSGTCSDSTVPFL